MKIKISKFFPMTILFAIVFGSLVKCESSWAATGTNLGCGKSIFFNEQSNEGIRYETNVRSADLNNDGATDLVYSRLNTSVYPNQPSFAVFLGDGTPDSFTAATQFGELFPANIKSMASYRIGDINRDNKADLIFTYRAPRTSLYDSVSIGIYLGLGNGTFSTLQSILIDDFISKAWIDSGLGIELGDTDADGDLDMLLTNGYDHLLFHYRNTTAQASSTVSLVLIEELGGEIGSVKMADFNGDGRSDFVGMAAPSTWGYPLVVGLSNPQNQSKFAGSIAGFNGPTGTLLVGKFDADTRPDFVIVRDTGPAGFTIITPFRNSGTGTFTSQPSLILPLGPQQLGRGAVAGNFSSDSKNDLVVGRVESPSGRSTYLTLRNTSTPGGIITFTQSAEIAFLRPFASLLGSADIEGDNLDEVLFKGLDSSTLTPANETSFLLNDSCRQIIVNP